MLFEATTLAATTTALATALRTYGCDPKSVFASAGLDIDELTRPGARFPFSRMPGLWNAAREASGDPCIGLMAAKSLKPQALHALGLSWMVSRTLYEGFLRMARYSRIANTGLKISMTETGNQVKLNPLVDVAGIARPREAIDATLAFIVTLCRFVTNRHFAPSLVTFRHENSDHIDQYIEFFASPVLFSQPEDAICFDAGSVHDAVPAGNEDLARETDRIAERYLATLEPGRVQDKVREILLTLLPSGDVDQQSVARAMHRSVSALQRQLKSEGASYRQVLDETRRQMAVRLIREREYTLGQIAYLLGFSDPANFTRAFRRWTGSTPGAYREIEQPALHERPS